MVMERGQVLADMRRDIDIERLLHWAIARQLADRIMEAAHSPEAYLGGVSADGCWAVLRYQILGTFIDCSGDAPILSNADLHPDAEAVYLAARDVLDPDALDFVVSCARRNTRPEWNPFPVVQIKPDLADRGRRGRVYVNPADGARFCMFDLLDRGPEIEHYRTLWLWWYDSLMAIQRAIGRRHLERWRVVEWQQNREPWR